MKTHCKYGHEFTPENTILRARASGGRRCRACERAYALARKRRNELGLNPDELKLLHRSRNLDYFYGLSIEAYNELLRKQNYICATPNCYTYHTEEKPLHVDHDHKCCADYNGRTRKTCGKCIRGLLCARCNLLLGLAEDDSGLLEGLKDYVTAWKKSIKMSSLEAMSIT
jgi:hypothetical protein